VALNGVDGFGDRFRCGAPAEAPAGHAPGFGEAVDDDGVLEMRRREAGDAFDPGAIVEQMLVNFIAHDEDAFFDADVAEGFDFLGRINGTGRVARGIEDEQARARGDGGAELLRRDFEFGFVGGLDNDRSRAGELDHFRVAQPVGGGDDDFIAFFAGGEDDVVTGMFAAAGDNDLRGLVGEAVFLFVFVGDGLAQFGNAGGGRVFGETVRERLGGGILDVLWRVKIRFARAEADDVFPGGLHGLGLRVNRECERWAERCGAFRNFVIHIGLEKIRAGRGSASEMGGAVVRAGGTFAERRDFIWHLISASAQDCLNAGKYQSVGIANREAA